MSLKAGEVAWRITGGKHARRLAWVDARTVQEASPNDKLKVALVLENVPYYGLWAAGQAEVKKKHLKQVRTVVVWSDQLP